MESPCPCWGPWKKKMMMIRDLGLTVSPVIMLYNDKERKKAEKVVHDMVKRAIEMEGTVTVRYWIPSFPLIAKARSFFTTLQISADRETRASTASASSRGITSPMSWASRPSMP